MSELTSDVLQRFYPSRDEALLRLKRFIPQAGLDYRKYRNFDYGPNKHDKVSLLSPYIRNGLITEEEVAATVLKHHTRSNADKFLQEVFWRTYWKGFLENRPEIWQNYQAEFREFQSKRSLLDALEHATEGRTGIESFDHWARELTETGYLHNHARMWFASIWIFTLGLPWQLGADFFFRHLLDGDPASNTLSWRWVAGLHTKGKAYLARPSNINKYTAGRFAEEHGLAKQAVALTEEKQTPPPKLEALPVAPVEVPNRTCLVLLDDSLCERSFPFKNIEAVIALYPEHSYDEFNLSEKVRHFRKACLTKHLETIQSKRSIPTSLLTSEFASSIATFARHHDLNTIALLNAQTGPWGDLWPRIEKELAAKDLTIVRYRHWWEDALYPHSTAGFFKLKQHLPAVLSRIESANETKASPKQLAP